MKYLELICKISIYLKRENYLILPLSIKKTCSYRSYIHLKVSVSDPNICYMTGFTAKEVRLFWLNIYMSLLSWKEKWTGNQMRVWCWLCAPFPIKVVEHYVCQSQLERFFQRKKNFLLKHSNILCIDHLSLSYKSWNLEKMFYNPFT